MELHSQSQPLEKMPICNSLIKAADESLCFTDWLKLMRDKDIEVLSATFDKRTDKQNYDVTAASIYFMALDQESKTIKAKDIDIISTMVDLELCAYCEKLRRGEHIWFPRKQRRGFNRYSIVKLLERAATAILMNIFESTNEDFFEMLADYLKKTNKKQVKDAASVWREK